MDSRSHIVKRGLKSKRCHRLGDNFCRERPDRVYAKDLAVFFLSHHLDETLVLAKDGCLTVADERELTGLHLEASLARLLFSQTDGPDLGLAICRVRATLAIKRLHIFTGHTPHRNNPLHRSGVRELGKPRDDVPDSIKMRLGGLEIRIRHYEATF